MGVFKCKMCGGSLEVKEGMTICECPYCETEQTIPRQNDDITINLFNRANRMRMKSEFDKAQVKYEELVLDCPDDPESYWGLILCKFGIEYVEDPVTNRMIPTLHRTQVNSVTSDPDYKSVLEYADDSQRELYEREAAEIDKLHKDVMAVVQNESAYDVFICYKEKDENGLRTRDSVIANDIYYQLTQEGLKVFYAAITLENKLGQEYEPYIYAALHSAKVMLVIGTCPEFFEAVWVRNEWSRYLKIVQADRSKLLIPCYRDMDPYELPEEFCNLQAQDMSKIGFITDIITGVKKVLEAKPNRASNTTVSEPEPGTTIQSPEVNYENILKRGYISLKGGEWREAKQFFNRVLDENPEEYRAYIGLLCAEMQAFDEEDLVNIGKTIKDSANYKQACLFGGQEVENRLSGYAALHKRNEELGIVYCVKESEDYQNSDYDDDPNKEKENLDIIRKSQLGDKVSFGPYEWIVMGKDNDLVLLLSSGCIGTGAYRREKLTEMQDTWENSDLRKWLNERFYYRFSKFNRMRICKTSNYNPDNYFYKTRGGNSTEDYIFLLSLQENERLRMSIRPDHETYYWLRSPGEAPDHAVYVSRSDVYPSGDNKTVVHIGIRPAMYLNLSMTVKYPVHKTAEYVLFSEMKYENKEDEYLSRIRNLRKGDWIDFGPYGWTVISATQREKVLFCNDIVEQREYHSSPSDLTWEESDLRKWLNEEFYNRFSSNEKALIGYSRITNSGNPEYQTPGGNTTDDYIYLLSYEEVSSLKWNNLIRQDDWWLRTPGSKQNQTSFIESWIKKPNLNGCSVNESHGVRPALKIKL